MSDDDLGAAVPLDGDRLDALERLAEKATRGPWAIDTSPGFEFHVRTGGTTLARNPEVGIPVADAALNADAEFIAATDPPTVLALVAALRASWAEVERLNGQLGDCIGCRYDEGPDEYCPQHGRTYTDVLDVTERMIRGTIAERDEARAALAAAERTLAEIKNVAHEHAKGGYSSYHRGARVAALDVLAAASRTGAAEQCSGKVGSRPSWMSESQYDACRCKRTADHEGDHACEHTDSLLADAFPESRNHDAAPPIGAADKEIGR